MELTLSLSLLIACSLLVQGMPKPMTTGKPKLILTNAEDKPQPILYHFIVDHRPTSLGQNYYIKPGQLVGTFNLDSSILHVQHKDSKRTVTRKFSS